jgi:broad specificity phosphatase PhoE
VGGKIDVILASPLLRARETADIIAEKFGLPVVIVDGLRERDFGEFEGRIKTLYPDWFNSFWNYHENLRYQRAENVQDFTRRIGSQIDEIKAKYAGKKVLVVAHGGVGLAFLANLKGVPADGDLLKFLISNGESMIFDIADEN